MQRDREDPEPIDDGPIAGESDSTDTEATSATKDDIQSQDSVEDSIMMGMGNPQSEYGQNSTKVVGSNDRDKDDARNEVMDDLSLNPVRSRIFLPFSNLFRSLKFVSSPPGSHSITSYPRRRTSRIRSFRKRSGRPTPKNQQGAPTGTGLRLTTPGSVGLMTIPRTC